MSDDKIVNMRYGNHGWKYLNREVEFLPDEYCVGHEGAPAWMWLEEKRYDRIFEQGRIEYRLCISTCPKDEYEATCDTGKDIPFSTVYLENLILGAVSIYLSRHHNNGGGLTFTSEEEAHRFRRIVEKNAQWLERIADDIRNQYSFSDNELGDFYGK